MSPSIKPKRPPMNPAVGGAAVALTLIWGGIVLYYIVNGNLLDALFWGAIGVATSSGVVTAGRHAAKKDKQ